MIDLHCHILPEIDDGAESLAMTTAMLDAAAAIGFTTVAATPHLVTPSSSIYMATVDDAFGCVEPLAQERSITLVPGYEIRLAPDVPRELGRDSAITLAGTRAVLVDLSFLDWPLFADDMLFAIQTAGYRPILAHPERYPRIQDDPAVGTELAERGIILQATIGSFAGVFGKRTKRTAEALLSLGVVHLVATDAHSAGHRMGAVPAGLERIESLVGAEGLRTLTLDAPSAILSGDPVPAPPIATIRSWRDRLLSFR